MDRPNSEKRTYSATILKIVLGVGLLVLALGAGFQTETLATALTTLQSGWGLAVLGLVIFGALCKIMRRSILLSGASSTASVKQIWRPFFVGQAFNMLAWARLGDIAQVWLLSSQTGSPASAVAAILVTENVLDLAVFGSLVLLFSTTLATIPAVGDRVGLIM